MGFEGPTFLWKLVAFVEHRYSYHGMWFDLGHGVWDIGSSLLAIHVTHFYHMFHAMLSVCSHNEMCVFCQDNGDGEVTMEESLGLKQGVR